MQLIIVAAVAENRVIGKNNQLVWRLPNDLKHFKRLTMGRPMIMGRKTFESFDEPLNGRTSIIITRDSTYSAEGCPVVHSLEAAIEVARPLHDEVIIAGGEEIYRMALPITDVMYLTEVKSQPEGDAFFPEFSKNDWRETARESFPADARHQCAYDFVTWERS